MSLMPSTGSQTLSALTPHPTNRAVFVGQTGSGKTTLAQYLLESRRFVVVYDAKGQIRWPGYKRFTKCKDVTRADPHATPRILYAPNVSEFRDPRIRDIFFRWVFLRKNCTVYVDELYLIMDEGGLFPHFYHACVAQGRERGVEVWSATQRPFRIPIVILSESEHFYVFRLQDRDSRKRMEEVSGIDEETIATLPKRQFYYAAIGEQPRGPLTLTIRR